MEEVFSFDDFLSKNGGKKPSTNSIKEEFLKDVEIVKESQESKEAEEPKKSQNDFEDEFQKENPYSPSKEDMDELFSSHEDDDFTKDEIQEVQNESAFVQNVEDDDDFYKLYQDKNEEFSCDIMIEGSSPEETYARIIIESENWSLVFPGEIKGGKCIVPIKKLGILKEGEIGNIKLEVVAEGNLFIPWENQYKVKVSKKVLVNVNESKKPVKKPIIPGKIGVKVNIK